MEDFDLRKYLAENRLLKENKIAQAIRDEAEQPDSKVGAAIFKRYAKKIEGASKEDYRKILTSMERELIDTHPDTFSGDDDIVASFMAALKEGTCGYTPDGKPRSKPAGPDLMNEFVGGTLEKRNNVLFNKLVPGSGASETVEGELIRAINRLVYRWYNDGDYFYKGYGAETAGPAHSFLTNSNQIPFELQTTLESTFNKAMSADENGYERLIKFALEKVVDHVEATPEDEYTPLSKEMFDFESEFQDEEEDDDYDDYYDEEDDDDYYQ